MSFSHRPDPLDRRITEAFEEIAGSRRPTYLDEILQRTAREPQRPAWTSIFRRPQPMNRLTYALVAAAVVAVLAGGALFFRATGNVGPPTTPSPAQSSAPAVVPESLRSTWLADAGSAGSATGSGSAVSLVVSSSGDSVSVIQGGTQTVVGQPVAGPPDELDVTTSDAVGGCAVGDMGRYRFALLADGALPASAGTFLRLTLLADSCATRSALLQRVWVHAIDSPSLGGRGISTQFAPMFLITLPFSSFGAGNSPDSMTASSSSLDRTLIAVRNPSGWSDPCPHIYNTKRPIEPTVAAFVAYMRTLPGFTVQTSDVTLGGQPATRLVVPTVPTADCESHRVYEWTSSDPADTGGWHLNQGDTDVIYLVKVGDNLVLLQWLGGGVTEEEERSVLSTITFTDTLPTPGS